MFKAKILPSLVFILFLLIPLFMRIFAWDKFQLDETVHQRDVLLIFKKIYFPFHTRVDVIAVGAFVAFCKHRGFILKGILSIVSGYLGILILILLMSYGGLQGGYYYITFQFSFVAMTVGLLVASKVSAVKGVLTWTIFRPIARYSYGIYLLHMMYIGDIFNLLLKWSYFDSSSPYLQYVLYLPVSFVAILIMETFFYFLIESPFLVWRKKILAEKTS